MDLSDAHGTTRGSITADSKPFSAQSEAFCCSLWRIIHPEHYSYIHYETASLEWLCYILFPNVLVYSLSNHNTFPLEIPLARLIPLCKIIFNIILHLYFRLWSDIILQFLDQNNYVKITILLLTRSYSSKWTFPFSSTLLRSFLCLDFSCST
jgi:hypothetical protein